MIQMEDKLYFREYWLRNILCELTCKKELAMVTHHGLVMSLPLNALEIATSAKLFCPSIDQHVERQACDMMPIVYYIGYLSFSEPNSKCCFLPTKP